MNTKKFILINGLLVIGMCLTAFIAMRAVLHMEKNYFQAMVGEVYENDPAAAEQLLRIAMRQGKDRSMKELLCQNLDREKISLGEKAAYQLGYTTEAYDIYYSRGSRRSLQNIFVLLMLVLGFAAIFFACYCHLSFRKNLDDLIHRIRKSVQEDSVFQERKDVTCQWESLPEWEMLEKEIHGIIDCMQKQSRYFEKREQQINLYVENLAHQIKTPLAGLLLNLEILEGKWPKQKETENQTVSSQKKGARSGLQLLADSRDLGTKIQKYIMRILNLARLEAGKIHFRKDSVELIALLEEIQQEFGDNEVRIECFREDVVGNRCQRGNYTENNASADGVITEDGAGDIVIKGDREWLYEAIFNLVDNSKKYAETNEPVIIRVTELQGEVKLGIIDQGKGIPEEEMEVLFDRYHVSGLSDQFSTGIGLNLARYVILGHYGEIHVESELNRGTKLEFRLPKFSLKEKISLV